MQEEFDYIELQKVFAFPMLCTEQYILLNRRVLTLEDTYTWWSGILSSFEIWIRLEEFPMVEG